MLIQKTAMRRFDAAELDRVDNSWARFSITFRHVLPPVATPPQTSSAYAGSRTAGLSPRAKWGDRL
ncbi:hypothetical protein CES86_5568 [Brucella lupini]|uniref:Uncharacterized protein n=1 Tax=Brucella lupini TaxID=255457 RepID=A0A256H0B7_9HYPH|nr:hypothetical protein CES86_5568 [Brucella lupini]